MTVLESLSAELTEYIAQRIREASPGRVVNHFLLVIDRPGAAPIVSGSASPDLQADLGKWVYDGVHGPRE